MIRRRALRQQQLQVFRAGQLFLCEVVTALKVVHTTVGDLDPFGRRGCVVDHGDLVDGFDDVLKKHVRVSHVHVGTNARTPDTWSRICRNRESEEGWIEIEGEIH